jgi:16S rRNA (guanine1207-N2)-methyltransferase
MRTLRLGGRTLESPRVDRLRDGALVFESPRGVNATTRFLVEALPKRPKARVLCGMDTEGATAMAVRALAPAADVVWCHFDAYVAEKVRGVLADNDVEDVDVRVVEDLSTGPFDTIALPFPAGAESQVMWDLLEAAHDALATGGRLVAATDGKPDALRSAVKKVFRNVTPGSLGRRVGASFYATRKRETSVLSDRAHVGRAVIRPVDGSPEIRLDVETRPGTFAYRRLDAGTRALAEVWTPAGEESVLDLGAGCGALGLSAALRLPEARVTLVDSNARAIGCARRNVERMGVADRVTTLVRADFEDVPQKAFDTVLANPPYFGDFRIARSFADTALWSLRRGGRALFVAKAGKAGSALTGVLRETFGQAEVTEYSGYDVVTAVRR